MSSILNIINVNDQQIPLKMTPNNRFTDFLRDIEPSKTTKAHARQAHLALRDTLRTDTDFSPYHRHTFLSGSYKRETAIRPRIKNGNAHRPDIDIIVVTNCGLNDGPKAVVDAVFSVLNRHYTPTHRQARSVSVTTRQADMDVVPLIDPYDDGTYHIADRLQSTWLRSNPPGHTQWTTDVNSATGLRFKPLVKLFKWWRRENPTIAKRPKGFVLEVLTAENMNRSEVHYGELFVQLLEKIASRYGWEVSIGQVPMLEDPSLAGNNVFAGLSFPAFEGLYKKIAEHAAIGRAALALEDQDKATEEWRKLFGPRFPKPPIRKSDSLLGSSTATSGLVFPDHPVRPPNKPAGFA